MPKSKILNWLFDKFGRTKKKEPEAEAIDYSADDQPKAVVGPKAQPVKRCTDSRCECIGRGYLTIVTPDGNRGRVPCRHSVKPDPETKVRANRGQRRARPGYIKAMRSARRLVRRDHPDRWSKGVRRRVRQLHARRRAVAR